MKMIVCKIFIRILSLLTAKFVKNIHIWVRIYFIFLKKFLTQTWNSLNNKFQPQWKVRKSSYKLKQISAFFAT